MNVLKLTISFFLGGILYSQNLPNELYLSADGKILYSGGLFPVSGVYDKTSVEDVNLIFSQTNYWTLLTNNYSTETSIPANMVYRGVTYPNVGVRFRGNTSYTQIGNSQKKSFGIETDFVNPDLKIFGYNDLKFNNAHQDPTFMREVLYNRMARKYTPLAKANYIHLFLNGQDWGIYPNIQDIDKSFLEEWFLSNDGALFRATVEGTSGGGGGGPTWGDGTAGMNYLGTSPSSYQQYYTLNSNDVVVDPWQKLIDACLAINQASAASLEVLKQKIDVDKVLWHLACENIFTDDDSYVMKGKMDYKVYYEPETGRTISLEYDGNSSFQTNLATSSNWGPFKNATNANYALINKLLSIPELRQRYLAHYRTILNESFTTSNANALIDEIDAQIGTLVAADTKKLYPTTQYTSGIAGLKNFVSNRRAFLLSNTEVAQVAPIIISAKYYNSQNQEYVAPLSNEVAQIKAVLNTNISLQAVYLYYGTGLVGNFTKTTMFDDGNHQDGAANDGIFGGQIPGFQAGTFVRYYIEAIANNTTLSASYLPQGAEHDVFVYTVNQLLGQNGVVINEIMAQNTSTITDENNQYEDWIELYNNNNFAVDLSGYYLSDDATNIQKWQIPQGTTISANGYLIIWADEDATEGPLHANFKLSTSGETLKLSDASNLLVDEVTFGTQQPNVGYARVPNGIGSFVLQQPTFNSNNNSLSVVSTTQETFLKIYPNPADEQLTISFDEQLIDKEWKIYTPQGQIILLQNAKAIQTLDVSGWASGIYFFNCGTFTKKIVVK